MNVPMHLLGEEVPKKIVKRLLDPCKKRFVGLFYVRNYEFKVWYAASVLKIRGTFTCKFWGKWG